jgi:hypothetical protein
MGLPSYSPVRGAVANAPTPTGSLGVSYFITDAATVLVDVGTTVVLSGGDPRIGLAAAAGLDWHF